MDIKKGTELEVAVTGLSSEGKGISKTDDGYVIFSAGTLPGDRALVKIKKKKSSYSESGLVSMLEPSPFRVSPQCSHFGTCGGCKIQSFDYRKQIEFKTGVVRNALQRIGGFTDLSVPEALPCDDIFYYRNKMEYSFSDDIWVENPANKSDSLFALGLHVPGFHSKIVDINDCKLQSEVSNRILGLTREFFLERNVSCYTTKTHSGLLRFLIIRQSRRTNDLMVNLVTSEYREDLMNEYSDFIKGNFVEVTTVVNGITKRKAQTSYSDEIHVITGSGIIEEKLRTSSGREFSFDISPNSFFQTNISQCEKLFKAAVEFAGLDSSDTVLDLYCGTGSISFFLAEKARHVTGVELVEDSIKDASANALKNGVGNCTFIASDIKDFLTGLEGKDRFSVAVLDPPRSGLHPEISKVLSESDFRRIIYVSCNPHTQARDLQIICAGGRYLPEKILPVDMFPHTLHVENIVSLLRV